MKTLPDVQTGSEEPLYNIGVVARMTGVSMPTLRAWERRYSFPESERTAGGHRLFSENDVLRLRWVKARIDEGMQTSQAIQALHHQEEVGRLVPAEQPQSWQEGHRTESGTHLGSYQQRLMETLLRRDVDNADRLLGEALPLSSPEDLILDLIGPTFAQIGQAWENGHISIATEHMATNYLRQRLLMWMLSGPPPRSTKPIVLTCAPNEWHEGGLLALGALLRRSRWPVAYLGQSLPLQDLASFVRDLKPNLVITVAMTEVSASELVDWPQYLPEVAQTGKPVIGYGGRVFNQLPEWRLRMQGVYLGDTLRDGMQAIERLLT
jgi:DNA-binding transcriptional MerR regulator